ncbi:hypothetical protein DGWBC_1799 [Dehalogenimonas sp. WBC-2]|nr:hypothetical protein DGWBC_1799 [Dehalogenimonas sp. WBC-2]
MLENLPSGTITALLNTLPIDLTFMDTDNRIQWFSGYRIFNRPPEVIGSDVRQCHQSSSWPAIDRMVADFKSGSRDVEEYFVDKSDGRKLHIRYLAVRDAAKEYLGLVEMVEEIKQPSPAPSHNSTG